MSGTTSHVPVAIPIVVGVTGHRDLDLSPAIGDKVRAAVHDVLQAMQKEFGSALYVMTALADGADQLVADVAEALKVPIIAVLPMPLAIYRTRVRDTNKLDHHWDNANRNTVLRIELPKTAVTGEPWAPRFDERLYEQLGAFLARRSHLLIALWEGPERHDPRGAAGHPGGTADVLRMRFDVQRAITAYRDSSLFERSASPLDAPHADPVLYIVAPRIQANGAAPRFSGSDPRPGACFLLRTWSGLDRDRVEPPAGIMKKLTHPVHNGFEEIKRLNEELLGHIKNERKVFEKQLEYLDTKGAPETIRTELDWLRRAQAGTDAAAGRYQRLLHGRFSAWKLRRIPLEALKSWLCRGPRAWPGGLLLCTAAVPVAVALFEWYAHLPLRVVGLASYLSLLFIVLVFHYCFIGRGKWQDHFQDYRAVAEAIRVQVYWALAAFPNAASDNYLRKQIGELGWISFALRGPALWGTSIALALKNPRRDIVRRGWMQAQAEYFIGKDGESGKMADNERARKRNRNWAYGSFGVGLFAAVLLLAAEGARCMPPEYCVVRWLQQLYTLRDEMIVAAATLPAIAAFLTVVSNLRAYQAHAHNYKQMGHIFARAMDVADGIGETDDEEFKGLVRDLGREALAENAEWLLDHRDREVEAGP